MIPTRYDYYKARSREHRRLALGSADAADRAMHERLVEAYTELARKYSLKQVVSLRPAAALAKLDMIAA